jgi:hypothetical protein
MNIKIKIERIDGGCEPYILTETKFSSLDIARESWGSTIAKFNGLASHVRLPSLKHHSEMVPVPDEPRAELNARERERLANQPKR